MGWMTGETAATTVCYPQVNRAVSHRLRNPVDWVWGWWPNWTDARRDVRAEGSAPYRQEYQTAGYKTTNSPTETHHSPAEKIQKHII